MCHSSFMDPAEREKNIEELVGKLRDTLLTSAHQINASDGMSAALIFTSRLAKALILCSQDPTSRVTNTKMIVEALRTLADDLEVEEENKPPMIMH